MTQAEKITRVKTLLDNDTTATDSLVTVFLAEARDTILNRMYPFGIPTEVTDVPTRYDTFECSLAQRYFLRRGAEGEIVHNENGVNRTYDSVSDEDILRNIIQVAKVG